MVQIINDPGRSGGLGEALGTGIGKGLSSGLQQLAQNKLNQILQKRENAITAKSLSDLGIDQQKAMAFASLPRDYRNELIKQGFLGSILQPDRQAEVSEQFNQQPSLESIVSPQQQTNPLEQFGENSKQILESLTKPYNPMDEMVQQKLNTQQVQQIEQPIVEKQAQYAQPESKKEEIGTPALSNDEIAGLSKELNFPSKRIKVIEKRVARSKPVTKKSFSPVDAFYLSSMNPKSIEQSIINNPFIPQSKKADFIKSQLRTQENAQKSAYKLYEKDYANTMSRINKIKDEDERYEKQLSEDIKNINAQESRVRQQVALVNTGKLTSPAAHSLLNTLEHGIWGFGVNLHGYESRQAQLYNKLHAQNASGVAKQLGGKMTQGEFNQTMKKYPGLEQSDDAKIEQFNAIYYDEILPKKTEYMVMQDLIKNNNGEIPENLKRKVDAISVDIVNKARRQFLESGKGEFSFKKPGVLSSMLQILPGDHSNVFSSKSGIEEMLGL